MDGSHRRVLVKDDLGLPNGLTYDRRSSQLCWADAGTSDVASACDITGGQQSAGVSRLQAHTPWNA